MGTNTQWVVEADIKGFLEVEPSKSALLPFGSRCLGRADRDAGGNREHDLLPSRRRGPGLLSG